MGADRYFDTRIEFLTYIFNKKYNINAHSFFDLADLENPSTIENYVSIAILRDSFIINYYYIKR